MFCGVLLALLLSSKTSCAANFAISDFVRPCGQISYLDATVNNGAVYGQSVTRSRLDCAQLCGMQGSCIGFNACQNETKSFDCEHMEKLIDSFSCGLVEARANCSFHMKISYNPTAYIEKAEQSLSAAGCPPDAFMLKEYHVCYWAVQSSHAYENLTACEDTGGYLAVLPSGTVMEKLEKLIETDGSISSSKYYWIDVNDLEEEGTYVNRFGPISWTAWDSGQPNDPTEIDDQDCTIMSPKYSYEWHDRNCLNEAGYYALCFKYLRGDGYRKRYVVHTDATNTTYGNMSELITDIDSGVAVRILIHDIPGGVFDDLLIQADAIFTYHDVTERRCVQSVHNVAQQLSSVLRIVVFACTTGSLRLEVWANGTQTETTYGVMMTWFTTDHPTTNALQASGYPNPSFNLTETILAGKDVMVQLDIARYPLHDVYYGMDMTGQFSWIASSTNWTSVMIDYQSYIHSVDWSDSKVNTFIKESASYSLIMTDAWRFVYSNAVGLEREGTILLLINYINTGHEVKVDIGGRVSRVDQIFIKSFQIFALLSSELISDNMQTNLRRTVTIVSSSGKIVTYQFGFDQNTYIIENTSEADVRWFVDATVWTEVYRTELSKTDHHGVFTLHEAMYAGQPIRLNVGTTFGYNILFTADFVAYHPGPESYIARFSRGFAVTFLNDGSIALNEPVHYVLIEVRSTGDYRYITIPNGISAINTTTSTTSETIAWYSKPYIF